MFDFVYETLNQMAFFVDFSVMGDGNCPGTLRGNHRLTTSPGNEGAQFVRIIGLVSQHLAEGKALEKINGLRDVGRLTGRENEAQRIAKPVDKDVDFAAQPSARASDGLILSPPFAPAAC